MTLDRVKLGRAVTFMKYLASVVSLIHGSAILLNLAELVVSKLQKVSPKKFINIPFSI